MILGAGGKGNSRAAGFAGPGLKAEIVGGERVILFDESKMPYREVVYTLRVHGPTTSWAVQKRLQE